MKPDVILVIILLLAIIGRNTSVAVATTFVLLLYLLDFNRFFPLLEKNTLKLGIIFLTIYVLIPFANGQVGLEKINSTIRSYNGLVAVIVGTFATVLAARGLNLLTIEPQITTGLLLGSIIGVAFFNGVPVGPLIGAGIVSIIIGLFQ